MNLSFVAAIIFYGLLLLFFFKNRDRFVVKGKIFAIYRTKLGLKLMDKIAKTFRTPLKILSYLSILIGFTGMLLMVGLLIYGIYSWVFIPNSSAVVAPVLPGIKIDGLPRLGFWHWIIGILIIAVVHEMSHGIFARLYNVKVKSSGFAFLGPILAAFVEPDEKVVKKRKTREQLSIMSAGPFSNITLAFIIFIIFNFSVPLLAGSGIEVNALIPDMPMEATGIATPFIITSINDIGTSNAKSFLQAVETIKPNEKIKLETDQGVYEIITAVSPEDETKGYIGVSNFRYKNKISDFLLNYTWLTGIVIWLSLLITWLFVFNLGIGLFNLLPLGPVDGGRMLQILALKIFKDKKKATKLWSGVSKFCLLLIFFNLLHFLEPYLIRLFNFIFNIV